MTLQWEPERETVDLTLEVIAQDTRRDEAVLAQLAEYGIGFDKGHDAHERDYGHRRKAAPKPPKVKVKYKPDWSDYLALVSALGIIAVCAVLFYQEWMQ